MKGDTPPCQGDCGSLVACSRRTVAPTRLHKLLWWLRTQGLTDTAHVVRSRLYERVCGKKAGIRSSLPPRAGQQSQEVLNLQPGELIEVKSERDILATLDANGRCKGLLWMPSMARLCGKRYRVRKRVERIMLESSGEIRKIRNTVLLEGATCENLYGCDRSCFHFWREVWLRRVDDDMRRESS
jgi:hypothetical protein